jgi:hypothetical protein
MRSWLGVVVVLGLVGGPGEAQAGLQFGAFTASQKVRPADRPALSPSATLRAAKNEFESFQLVLLSSGGATQGVSVKLARPLARTTGATIPAKNVTLYVARYYQVGAPSNGEGASGAWPDPLVPDVDTYYSEKRNAFPLDVPDGESRVVWVDILVPVDAQAGMYAGALEVSVGGSAVGQLSIGLEVGSFALPSTASLATAFGMGWSAPCEAHFGDDTCGSGWDEDRAGAFRVLYLRCALDHRFNISDISYQPPVGASVAPFEKYVLPLVNGTGPTRLAGAKVTAVRIDGDPAQFIPYAKSKGFYDRTFRYTVDEPNNDSSMWSQFISDGKALHQVDATARMLITSNIANATAFGATSQVDLFCPVINEIDDKSGMKYAGDQTGTYKSWLAGAANRRLWSYQSCMSHGCGECGDTTTDPYANGWPNRVIDSSAVQDRAFPWIAFKYGLTGELYFDTTNQLSTAWDANGQCKYGGSGDGTIFYPGKPSIIGGSHDIPVESIRIKMIREGMEDYEYLVLAAAKDAQKTRAIVDGLFSHTYSCAQPASKLEQARSQLFDMLNVPPPPDPDGVRREAGAAGGVDGDGGIDTTSGQQGPGGGLDGGCGLARAPAGRGAALIAGTVALLTLLGLRRRSRRSRRRGVAGRPPG